MGSDIALVHSVEFCFCGASAALCAIFYVGSMRVYPHKGSALLQRHCVGVLLTAFSFRANYFFALLLNGGSCMNSCGRVRKEPIPLGLSQACFSCFSHITYSKKCIHSFRS